MYVCVCPQIDILHWGLQTETLCSCFISNVHATGLITRVFGEDYEIGMFSFWVSPLMLLVIIAPSPETFFLRNLQLCTLRRWVPWAPGSGIMPHLTCVKEPFSALTCFAALCRGGRYYQSTCRREDHSLFDVFPSLKVCQPLRVNHIIFAPT
jgi:hypothetical protein